MRTIWTFILALLLATPAFADPGPGLAPIGPQVPVSSGGGGGTPTIDGPGYQINTWYVPGQWLWAAGGTPSTTLTYCTPGWVGSVAAAGGGTMTIGSLGVRLGTAGTTSIALAIYSNDTSVAPNRPGNLLGNTGAIVSTGGGVINGSVSISGITPGTYWWCSQAGDTTVRWYARTGNNNDTWGGSKIGSGTQGDIVGTTSLGGVSTPGTYGTWPSSLHGNTWTEITNTAAAVEFEVGSIP